MIGPGQQRFAVVCAYGCVHVGSRQLPGVFGSCAPCSVYVLCERLQLHSFHRRSPPINDQRAAAMAATRRALPSAGKLTQPLVSSRTPPRPLPLPLLLLPSALLLGWSPSRRPAALLAAAAAAAAASAGEGVLTCTVASCLQLGSSRIRMMLLPRVRLPSLLHEAAVSCCRAGLAQLKADRKRHPDRSTLCSSRLPAHASTQDSQSQGSSSSNSDCFCSSTHTRLRAASCVSDGRCSARCHCPHNSQTPPKTHPPSPIALLPPTCKVQGGDAMAAVEADPLQGRQPVQHDLQLRPGGPPTPVHVELLQRRHLDSRQQQRSGSA